MGAKIKAPVPVRQERKIEFHKGKSDDAKDEVQLAYKHLHKALKSLTSK